MTDDALSYVRLKRGQKLRCYLSCDDDGADDTILF
jgi:hypothetical protein